MMKAPRLPFWALSACVFIFVGVVALLTFHYEVLVPGPTEETRGLVRLDASGDSFRPGAFVVTSVSVRRFNPYLALRALLDPDAVQLVPRREPENNAGELSAGQIEPDQTEISKQNALAAALEYRGESVEHSDLVREIVISTRGFRGPSAGLMLALGIIDRVSEEDLTRGRRIAGTGVISTDGRVTEVGAIAQKVRAAENARAELMLVPYTQAAEAKAAARIQVMGVRDLADAVHQLRAATDPGYHS